MKKANKKVIKSEFVEQLAIDLRIPVVEAERNLNTVIHNIYEILKSDRVVSISGFGQFSVSHREARIGVNPRNPDQKITIPKLNTPKFRAGEAFKEAVKLRG